MNINMGTNWMYRNLCINGIKLPKHGLSSIKWVYDHIFLQSLSIHFLKLMKQTILPKFMNFLRKSLFTHFTLT